MQPIMAPTSSRSLVELSTDEHETTFMNITQMLSNVTRTPRLKWLDNLSPLHQPQKLYSYSKHLLLLQYNHLLLPQHPSKLQPKSLQQRPTSSGRHLQPQMFNHQLAELLSHLADLVVSVRHHNALLSICHPYSSNPHPVEGTCNHRCSTTNRQNCCRTSPIWLCQ